MNFISKNVYQTQIFLVPQSLRYLMQTLIDRDTLLKHMQAALRTSELS